MNYEENGITLGQLLSVVKKSFKKALLYVLISVLATSALLLTVRSFTRSNTYNSTVTVSSQNDSTLLSDFNVNKRLAVSNAVSKLEISQDLVSDIVANTTITAQIPEDFDDKVFYPNVFKISVNPDKSFGLDNNQYVSLVDQISIEYVNVFSTVNFPTIITSYKRDGVGTNYEYLRYVDGIYNNINTAISSINLFISNSGLDANSKELTNINILLAGLNDLLNSTEQLRQYIIGNSVEITDGSISNYLSVEESIAQAEITKYEKLVSTAQVALNNYSSVISNITNGNNSAGNIYYLNDEGFIKLTKELMYYQQLEADAIERKAKISVYKTIDTNSIAKTENAVNYTSAQFTAIASNFDTLLETYHQIESDYNSNQNLTSKAQVTIPASKVTNNTISIGLIIVIDFLVALIAYSVAFGKTFSVMKKQGAFESREIQ